MAITVADIQTEVNTYIQDSGTNTVTAAQRLSAMTEGTVWLIEELGNDHTIKTSVIKYLDTINYYKITTSVANLLQGADLRREESEQRRTASPKSSREMAEEIGSENTEDSWAIERRDGDSFLAINYNPLKRKVPVSSFDTFTDAGGTWVVDDTNSDATNLTVDSNERKEGVASLNFDADVSQSGNNKSTIYNPTVTTNNLSDNEDLASYLFWVYIPDVTNFSSVTLYWGSDEEATPATIANYWSHTVTTDIDGAAFSDGWNQIKIDWQDATKTSSPDVTAILYYQIDFNYTGSQGDDTDFRVDYLRLANPEDLIFHYSSFVIGTDTTGATDRTIFSATSDIPYFSGQYDQYKFAVAHKAASILLRAMHQNQEAEREVVEADNLLVNVRRIFPDSKVEEVHSFKIMGNVFPKRRGRSSHRKI